MRRSEDLNWWMVIDPFLRLTILKVVERLICIISIRRIPIKGIPWGMVVTIMLMIFGILITETTIQYRFIICPLCFELSEINIINSFGMESCGVWPGSKY